MSQEAREKRELTELIAGGGNLPLELILDIAQQVGEYLEELHRGDEVHGNLSPGSIVLTSDGEVRVLDPQPDAEVVAIYQAPEIRGEGDPTRQADFYALGASLYEALTGEAPELSIDDPWPGNKRPGLPPELDELVFKCLQADPSKRVQSAAELLHGIQGVRHGMQAGGKDTILGVEDALVGHALGAYQLVERLGQGGMATVYKAYEPALDRYVAIKVLPQFFARDPNFMQRFRREAKAAAQLNHPNIVPTYSFGEEGDITYIAMQYVEGGTLKQARGQVYAPAQAVQIAAPIVRALAYAHGRGIVHRDIKPANVLMSEGDWPLLTDFGLAKMAEASTRLTGTGVGVGTPMYMSPEQGQGVDVDHRTDVYSMGIMLYEMVTGDVPFRADTPMAIVIKHMTAPLPMPRSVNPDIPEPLERIILKATAKNPDDRFQSADEMLAALERVQQLLMAGPGAATVIPGELETAAPKTAKPGDRGEKSPLAGKIKKAGLIFGSVVGVLLLGVILMWVFNICPPSGPWPIPPWCPGTTYNLPAFGDDNEATPTSVVTDGSLGNLLFEDDFEGEISARWQFTASQYLVPWAAEEVNGRTVMRSTPPTKAGEMNSAEIRDTGWENYAIQFDFRFDQPDAFGEHYFWLRGRVTDCPPTVQALQAYSVQVTSTGTQILRMDCSTGAERTVGTNGIGLEISDWHNLLLVFINSKTQVYMDGQHIIDFIDEDPLSGGDLWIETMGEILIDDFKVYEVIPGEGGVIVPAADPFVTELCESGETLLLYENFNDQETWGWDFSDSNGNPTEPWGIRVDEVGNPVLSAGGHSWAVYPGIDQSDISFSLRFRKGSMGSSPFHINIGMSEGSRYYFSLEGLWKDIGSENSLLAQPLSDTNTHDTDWHDLRIVVVDGFIQTYIDGQLYLEYQDDDPLPAGYIGIENTNDNVWYDDILICSAGEESAQSVENVFAAVQSYEDDFEAGYAEFWDPEDTGNWQVGTWEIAPVDGTNALHGSGELYFAGGEAILEDFDLSLDIYLDDAVAWQSKILLSLIFPINECAWYNLELDLRGGGLDKSPCETDTSNQGFEMTAALETEMWHEVRVSMAADQIKVWVDDAQVLDVADDLSPDDLKGFWISIGDHGEGVYLDNFSLQIVEPITADQLFQDSGQRISNRYTRSLDVEDVDGDGDIDLLAGVSWDASSIWLNDGGRFSQSFVVPESNQTTGAAMRDFTGDGLADFFLANWESTSQFWVGKADGNFELIQELETQSDTYGAWSVAPGDLDGDGDSDLWIAAGGVNQVWLNDGGGFALDSDRYRGGDSVGVDLGDLDGDGDLDAFVANYVGGANFVFFNNGDGTFTDSGQELGNTPSNSVALGDLDGDGDLDAFVVTLENQPNEVWFNNGYGSFVDSGQRLGALASNAVALGDLDNDGDLDAYVVNGLQDQGIPQANTIYFNDGAGNFTALEHRANLTISTDVILYDLDGDDWLDVIEATSETILIWMHSDEVLSSRPGMSGSLIL